MELKHLRALVAVVEEGSFRRAADRLGYTQSGVSQQIAALERSLRGPVLERPGGPRAARLTPLGEVVLDRGRRLLLAADELDNALDRFRAGPDRIDIGTFQSVSTVILPSLVSRLRDELPGCQVRLSEGEPEDPRTGDLDLLFYDGVVSEDVESVKLLDDPYVLVARPGQFPEGPVAVRDLDGSAMVAWPSTCDQPRLESVLRASGAQPDVVFRSASNEALLAMVRAGVGCAVLPRLAVRGAEVDPQTRVHPLEPTPFREVHLHWPKGRPLSPVAARAVELAREIAHDLGHAACDHDPRAR